jgi:hypothetical protein
MTLPRLRFTSRGMMIAVAVSAVALAYVGTGSTKLGCGETSVWLTFHVVDDVDGRPITGARITFIKGYSVSPIASTMTGDDGSARVSCRAGCTSYRGPFFRSYRYLYFGEALQIEADGYQSVHRSLKEYTSSPACHDPAARPPIPIRLKRMPRTETWNG